MKTDEKKLPKSGDHKRSRNEELDRYPLATLELALQILSNKLEQGRPRIVDASNDFSCRNDFSTI